MFPEAMDERPSRRAVLGAAGSACAAATAGCFSSLRSRVAYTPSQQVQLSVKAVPADVDPSATAVARALRDNLEAVGTDVTLELLGQDQLLRDVLLNHEFDCAVVRVPGHDEPDELRPLVHSRFAEEEGWQNPGGVAHRRLDRLAERQRRRGTDRDGALADLQRTLHRERGVVPLVAPAHLGVLATDVEATGSTSTGEPLAYLGFAPPGDRLRVELLHGYLTINRNVLGAEFRVRDPLLDLVYDRLARRIDGEVVPWLARDWTNVVGGVVVELRPDLQWHDGTSLTAEDVAFTYRLLRDATLGRADSPVPAPRFRSRSSLVERVSVLGDRRVRLHLGDTRRELVPHALTVPVLPEHRWRERAELEREYLPRALVDPVEEPVGSGPLAQADAQPEQSVTFRRFDDHFLRSAGELPAALEPYRDGPEYETLQARYATNPGAAVNAVAAGTSHVVEGSLPPSEEPAARAASGVRVVETSGDGYYALVFNVRRSPLGHHGFRAAVTRLLDRGHLAESVFRGHARPTVTPLVDDAPPDLAWDDGLSDFAGEDGELDAADARSAFVEAGFRYHQGALYARQ